MSHLTGIRRLFTIAVALAALVSTAQCLAFDLGLETKEPVLSQGYTCCNLHYEGDWISDANWGALPFVPAGTPIKVSGYGRYRANVDMNGKKMRIGQDYGREQESLEKFTTKLVVQENPNVRIGKFPQKVREAIAQGQVAEGMTKEQVIIAVGYPQTDMTASLDAPIWNYWASSFGGYQVVWGKDGRVKEITGDAETLLRMVHRK